MTPPGAASQRHVDRLAGNLLRMARARTGVSQAQLAELAGVPRSTVERVEDGDRADRTAPGGAHDTAGGGA